MIQNKESLVYSLESSIYNLENVVKKSVQINTPQQREVYSSLGTPLLWIGSYLDRLENIEYTDEEFKYVQAFKQAYNAQKHGVDLVGFTGFISGSSFPIRFPKLVCLSFSSISKGGKIDFPKNFFLTKEFYCREEMQIMHCQ